MRGLLRLTAICALIAAIYAATPFYAAWQLREAIRTADVETIAHKVDWLPVRASLRASLARNANLRPLAVEAGRRVRPTLWQRVRLLFGGSMLDRFMNTYITPVGLPKLYQLRENKRGSPGKFADPVTPTDWRTRLQRAMARLHRAEFTGLTTVVIEVASRTDPFQRFEATFNLVWFEWKLTRLVVNVTRPNRRLEAARS